MFPKKTSSKGIASLTSIDPYQVMTSQRIRNSHISPSNVENYYILANLHLQVLENYNQIMDFVFILQRTRSLKLLYKIL